MVSAFQQISETIDAGLKGYPDRHQSVQENRAFWGCRSKLFDFDLTLQESGGGWRFTANFQCPLNLDFHVSRVDHPSWIQKMIDRFNRKTDPDLRHRFRISGGNKEPSRTFVKRKELLPLLEKVRFYDSIYVHAYGLTACRNVKGTEDLTAWPEALGGTITLIRYALSFKDLTLPTGDGNALCPYCRGTILEEKEELVLCKECKTIHHQDCWDETRRCSVFGCGGRVGLVSS